MYSGTEYNLAVLMEAFGGAILAIFKPFQHDFKAQSMTIGSVRSQFLTLLLPKKAPKVPTSIVWLHSAPLYMIWCHLGHFG